MAGGVRTSSAQRFYEVEGATAAELLTAMLDRGPTTSGLPVYATTEWEVRWRSRTARHAALCRIENVDVVLHITTVLPRWKKPAQATNQLEDDWTAFQAALRTHERGHHDLGVTAARSVLERLRGFRGFSAASCEALIAELDGAAQKTLGVFHELNLKYDVDTAHGATQGVAWPPRSWHECQERSPASDGPRLDARRRDYRLSEMVVRP